MRFPGEGLTVEQWRNKYGITEEQLRPGGKAEEESRPSREGAFWVLEREGRSYSSFLEKIDQRQLNFYPDDAEEARLQDAMHQIWLKLKKGLFMAPLKRDKPLQVIDVGCGSSIWANELAKNNGFQVEGFDVSKIIPGGSAANLYHHDCNCSLPTDTFYDLIPVREMLWCFSDLNRFAERCYNALSSHGYVELSQGNLIPLVDEEDLRGLAKWKTNILHAGRKLKVPVGICPGDVVRLFERKNLRATYTAHVLPINPDEENFKVFETSFRQVSLRLLTLSGTSSVQATLDIANAMADLKRSKALRWELFTIHARKFFFNPGQFETGSQYIKELETKATSCH